MEESARAFGWREWPFRIVADAQFARVWADRSILREEIERRLRRLRSVPHSTIQIIWADFGAGKTHTLRNLEARCLDAPDQGLVPLYTEVAVASDGLVDLFRSFVNAFPTELLSELADRAKRTGGRTPTSSGARDLRQALKLLASEDSASRSIAMEWLQATPGSPNLRALKSFGINARVEDDTRVVEILASLIALIREVRNNAAVLWLVDEFQRVADVPVRKRDAFAKSIVSLFNSCPSGLHFALSFSVAQQATALALIPPDLRSRAATFPMLMLPHLGREDCLAFACDLFAAFRVEPGGKPEHPFALDALEAVIDDLEASRAGAVTPRLLMERLESLLFELYEIEGGRPRTPVTAAAVRRATERISARDRSDS